jgi:hypothetical protein
VGGQVQGEPLIRPRVATDKARMETLRHESLRSVVVDMIRSAAANGPDGYMPELTRMLNALFGLDLRVDEVAAATGSAALARRVELAWLERGGTDAELEERLAALTDD